MSSIASMIQSHRTNLTTQSKSLKEAFGSRLNQAGGLNLNTSGNGTNGQAIADRYQAQVKGLNSGIQNAQRGMETLQVASGGLSQINDSLERMRTLAAEASNGALNEDERATLNREFTMLRDYITEVAETTSDRGVKLFESNHTISVDLGNSTTLAIEFKKVGAEDLGLADASVTTRDGASSAVEAIDKALDAVQSQSNGFSSSFTKLDQATRRLAGTAMASQTRIKDPEFAAETATVTKGQMLRMSAMTSTAVASIHSGMALSLLGGN